MAVVHRGATDSIERITRVVSAAETGFRRSFLAMVREMVDEHTLAELTALLAAGNAQEALAVFDRAAQTFATQYNTAYVAAGTSAAAFLSNEALTVDVRFDQTNDRAVRQMEQGKLHAKIQLGERQKRVTRNALRDGIAEGFGPRQQARAFRESIGLTDTQRIHVANFRQELTGGYNGVPSLRLQTKDGQPITVRRLRDGRFNSAINRAIRDKERLSDAQIDRMVTRYRERYIKYRSEVIARTESLRAVHQATEEAYQQGIDAGQFREDQLIRTWRSVGDDRVRDSHVILNGQERGENGGWQGIHGFIRYPCDPDAPPEESISCRCVVTTRILSEAQADRRAQALVA